MFVFLIRARYPLQFFRQQLFGRGVLEIMIILAKETINIGKANMKNKIGSTLMILIPAISGAVGPNVTVLKNDIVESSSNFVLNSGDHIQLQMDGMNIDFTHFMASRFVSKSQNEDTDIRVIGVNIHEEARFVDFSSLDGVVVRIPFEKINKVPPNGLME